MRTRAFRGFRGRIADGGEPGARRRRRASRRIETTVTLDQAGIIADRGHRARPRGLQVKSGQQHLNLAVTVARPPSWSPRASRWDAAEAGPEGRARHRRRQPQPVLRRLPQLLRGRRHRRRAARRSPHNQDVVKLVQIGTSLLGKPILALKITSDARNVPDGTRPSVLYGAVNRA